MRRRRSRSASCRFIPGPGLGGHCIPIDPFYLSWKTKQSRLRAALHRAGRPHQRRHAALRRRQGRRRAERPGGRRLTAPASSSLGVAYKRDIDDMRESPALDVMRLLQEKGGECGLHGSVRTERCTAREWLASRDPAVEITRGVDRARTTASSSSLITRLSTTRRCSTKRISSSIREMRSRRRYPHVLRLGRRA